MTDTPVSTLDISAAFYDYANVEPGLPKHGTSLRPLLAGDGSRDFTLMEWELLSNRVGVALSLRTVRAKSSKLTKDLRSGAGEMYDLAADPHETQNTFDDPVYANLQGDLMQRPDEVGPINTPVGPG